MLQLSLIFALAVAILIPSKALSQTRPQATYYVDPVKGNNSNSGTRPGRAFKTLEKARDVVRTINTNMTGDIYVYLRGGNHWRTSTFNLTDADSGTNGYNIIYSAYKEEKPVISGGRQITGWTIHDTSQNIYKAYAGNIETRQLYVNGKRATRARSTGTPSGITFDINTGYTASGNLFVDNAAPMNTWMNTSDIEFVYNNVFAHYRTGTSGVSYDDTKTTVTMKQPGWSHATTPNKGGTRVQASFLPDYIENAYELLDVEGEWYLNRVTDTIYYKPKAGEDIATSEVIAPVVEELVRIQGANIGQKATNIQFYGISFNYTTWLKPSGNNGHTTAQNGVICEAAFTTSTNSQSIVGATVALQYANALKFERCSFEHLGGAGLNMYAGCQDNQILGSRFMDISANGIQAGDYNGYNISSSENFYNPSDARLILRNNDIYNSYFYKTGAEYFSSSAIAAAFPQDMDIVHSEIGNVPYTGIHIGWGWIGLPTSVMKNNRVDYCYIHDLNLVCIDGAPIYTNGKTGGDATLYGGYFSNNYLKNSNWYSMYDDEGSTWYNWSNNVIDGASQYAFTWRSNNILFDKTYTNVSKHTGGTATNTTIVSGAWPTEAQTIINNAGLEQSYKNIKPTTIPLE